MSHFGPENPLSSGQIEGLRVVFSRRTGKCVAGFFPNDLPSWKLKLEDTLPGCVGKTA